MIRRLLLAVAASLAAHALVLGAAGRLPSPRAPRAEEAIDFDLVEREVGRGSEEEAAAAPRRVARAVTPAAPAAAPVAGAAEAPLAPEEAAARDAPGPGALPAADVLPAGGGGIPVAVAAGAVSGANTGSEGSSGGPGGGAGPAGSGGAEPDGAGGAVHAAILGRLRSRTAGCYPRAAVRRSVEGVARVSFCVGADGAPADLRLVASSGSGLLDEAALSCVVRGAAPLPGAGACVKVPIDFHLRR